MLFAVFYPRGFGLYTFYVEYSCSAETNKSKDIFFKYKKIHTDEYDFITCGSDRRMRCWVVTLSIPDSMTSD